MITLVAATPAETAILQKKLNGAASTRCGRYELSKGRLSGHLVTMMHTVVGKVNAALATEALLSDRRPKAVILFGIGGAYPKSGLGIGDVALATEEIYGDEGVAAPDGFLDMQNLGFTLCNTDDASFYNHLPLNLEYIDDIQEQLSTLLIPQGRAVASGPFVTVSTCSGTDSLAREMAARTGGLCENMEGAAVAQVCLQHRVPLIELRSISNMTGDRNPGDWKIPLASETAQYCVLELLQNWPGPEK